MTSHNQGGKKQFHADNGCKPICVNIFQFYTFFSTLICCITYNLNGGVQKITRFVLHILTLQHIHTMKLHQLA